MKEEGEGNSTQGNRASGRTGAQGFQERDVVLLEVPVGGRSGGVCVWEAM